MGQVFRVAEVKHLQGFLLERLVEGLVDQPFIEFLRDFLLETLFHNRPRGLARAETLDARLAGIGVDDLIALAPDLVRGNLNSKGGYAFGLLVDNNVHVLL